MEATWHSLQNHLYENATFLAERLCAEMQNEAARLNLATCYLMAGAANRAASVLAGATAPQNRYLLAVCCMRLGRLSDASTALLGPGNPDNEAVANVPNGACGLYLIGMVCVKLQHRARAIKYLTRSLTANPFLWSSYEALCHLGAPLPEGLSPPPMLFASSDSSIPLLSTTPGPDTSESYAGGCGGLGGVSSSAGFAPHSLATGSACGPASTPLVGVAAAASGTPLRNTQLFTPSEAASTSTGAPFSACVPASAGLGRPMTTPQMQTPVAGAGNERVMRGQ